MNDTSIAQPPAVRSFREATKPSRRDCVLACARSLFASRGYASTTIEHIAARAELSVGSIYNLVGNKDAVYGAIVSVIADDLLNFVSDQILPIDDHEQALVKLARYRLQRHDEHRLFLDLFASNGLSYALPEVDSQDLTLAVRYKEYLNIVGKFLQNGTDAVATPLNLALAFDGVVSAFDGFPAPETRGDNLTEYVRVVVQMFSLLAHSGVNEGAGFPACESELFISVFDYERLQELLHVARIFGNDDEHVYLAGLTERLSSARIVASPVVPPHVITMNSRFLLIDETDGETRTCRLVFPSDVKNACTISIISPLGSLVIGARPGDRLQPATGDYTQTFRVGKLLYQPESAGDFHL